MKLFFRKRKSLCDKCVEAYGEEFGEIYDNKVTPPVARIVIHTLEGDMEVSKGDYVIKGVKGEFYPCKPDIFEQTYESAETQKEQEEAAEEFAEGEWDGVVVDTDGNPLYAQDEIEYTFKVGAEWQKSQMLKDVYVESQIVEDGRIELEGNPLPCLNPIILLPYPQFEPGDKVRIVVLKEEEE